jgi:hypothetical protein
MDLTVPTTNSFFGKRAYTGKAAYSNRPADDTPFVHDRILLYKYYETTTNGGAVTTGVANMWAKFKIRGLHKGKV